MANKRGPKGKKEPELALPEGQFEPLASISPRAKQIFYKELPNVQDVLVRVQDAAIFSRYCQTLARLEEHEKTYAKLEKKGQLFFQNGVGGLNVHPIVSVIAKLDNQLATLAKSLGMTPAGRKAATGRGSTGGGKQRSDIPSHKLKERDHLEAKAKGARNGNLN